MQSTRQQGPNQEKKKSQKKVKNWKRRAGREPFQLISCNT